jgi:hypothetical protein
MAQPSKWYLVRWLLQLWRAPSHSQASVSVTPEEQRLQTQAAYLQRQLQDLQVENETLKSRVQIQELQIRLLTSVNERNQKRVEAETAEYAARIALATGPLDKR